MSDTELLELFHRLYAEETTAEYPHWERTEFTDMLLKDMFPFLKMIYLTAQENVPLQAPGTGA